MVAALRSFAIPARIARIAPVSGFPEGMTWVEYYDSGDWHPAFLDADGLDDDSYLQTKRVPVPAVYTTSAFERALVTDRYTSCGEIELCIARDGTPVAGFESFSVNVLVDGKLRPLDELAFGGETSTGDDGCVSLEVGEGSYIVQAGDRVKSGDVLVFLEPVEVAAGDTVRVDFNLPEGEDSN